MVNPQRVSVFRQLSQQTLVRFLCYIAAFLAAAIVTKMVTALVVPAAPSPWHNPLMLFRNLTLLATVFTTYVFLVHLLERRAALEVNLRTGTLAYPAGIFVGGAAIGLIYLTLWSLGRAHFVFNTGTQGLVLALAYHASTAMFEELIFRGILFRLLEESFGTALALVVSVVVFGLAHVGNPGATVATIAALGIGLGTLLTLAYILTRNIWLAAGIHMGWNFMQGYVFGADVSGLSQPKSILIASLSGSNLLTGGGFGPEGSILSVAITGLVACAILTVLIRRRDAWQPLRFRPRMPGQ